MERVYIVTAGRYSNYTIEAVFDNEEEARKYCETNNRKGKFRESRVEIYPMNDKNIKCKITSVMIDREGNVMESNKDTYWHEDYEWDYQTDKVKHIWGNSTRGKDVALKVARDKLNMLQAEENNLI